MQFVRYLEPRKYTIDGDIIQEQYEEIFEVVFIMNGAVGVGYRLFDEMFFGKKIIIPKGSRVLNRRKLNVINDYSCLTQKGSEFFYRALEVSEALAMRRPYFLEQMEEQMAKKIKVQIARLYKKNIQ